MKNCCKFASLILFLTLLASCAQDDIPPLGEPSDKLEGINDEFELDQVIFYDNITPFDDNSLNVSEEFIGSEPLTIVFDKDEMIYTVDPGTTLNFFGQSGNWKFDNAEFPTYIIFEPENLEPELRTKLLRTIRPQDEQLQIIIGGGCDKTSVSYELYFNRK